MDETKYLVYKTKEECIEAMAEAFYSRSTGNRCPDKNRCYSCEGTDEQIRKCALATAEYFWNRMEEVKEYCNEQT